MPRKSLSGPSSVLFSIPVLCFKVPNVFSLLFNATVWQVEDVSKNWKDDCKNEDIKLLYDVFERCCDSDKKSFWWKILRSAVNSVKNGQLECDMWELEYMLKL